MNDDETTFSGTAVYISMVQPDTKSNLNPNTTTKQHTVVSIQLNIVTCPTYPDTFIRRLYCFQLSM